MSFQKFIKFSHWNFELFNYKIQTFFINTFLFSFLNEDKILILVRPQSWRKYIRIYYSRALVEPT